MSPPITSDGPTRPSGPFQNASATASPVRRRRRLRPFSLRLTFEERGRLEKDAGNMPLGAYIRSRLFDKPASDRRPRRYKRPVKDDQALGQLLGVAGQGQNRQ